MTQPSKSLPPDELRREVQAIDWWHQIDLGHGIVTTGRGGDTHARLERLHLPADLSGRTVIDIGAWDGLSVLRPSAAGANESSPLAKPLSWLGVARHVLESKVESVHADLMELTPEAVREPFNVVLVVGVLYHLPDAAAGCAGFTSSCPRAA